MRRGCTELGEEAVRCTPPLHTFLQDVGWCGRTLSWQRTLLTLFPMATCCPASSAQAPGVLAGSSVAGPPEDGAGSPRYLQDEPATDSQNSLLGRGSGGPGPAGGGVLVPSCTSEQVILARPPSCSCPAARRSGFRYQLPARSS